VTSTTDPVGCKADLIINSNVLEHVGFPRQLLGECLKASPAGGLIFIEVPCESPFGWDRIIRRIGQIGITSITRPGLARSVLRPSSLYMMHEHVNYFTERSLATLMRSSGGAVIGSGSYSLDNGNVAWCLGTTTCA
jgi:hypothetical protein